MSSEIQYRLFNTDETEEAGRGKHTIMLKRQVVAAWGHCKGIGAEATLNRPAAGDEIYYFRAGFGIIARAIASERRSLSSQAVFAQRREFERPVEQIQILPMKMPVTVSEIKNVTGYQIPYRQIMGRILNERAVTYLEHRFVGTKPKSRRRPSKATAKRGYFQPDPEIKKKVEKAAIRFVTMRYRRAGWQVRLDAR